MTQEDWSKLKTGGRLFAGGVAIGMLVGAISGVLFAPCSGEDTRERLGKQANGLLHREHLTGTPESSEANCQQLTVE